jgi:uncharacterized protein DUF3306
MSEDFLKRWSRRKHDAAEAEAEQAKRVPEDSAHDSAAPAGDERSIEPVEAIKPVQQPEPVFDLKDLPPIESITAATDIRPFLAPGVPVDIARAALRRAWSADRRIRDFVGLADYDFDYHAVGGAAGFGPLEMTDELRRAVARILGEITDERMSDQAGDLVVGTGSPEKSRSLSAAAGALPTARPHGPGGHPHDALPNASGQDEPAAVVEPAAQVFAATQHQVREGQVDRPMSRRTHGRALPK